MGIDENGEFEWGYRLDKSRSRNDIPDHIFHEAEQVSVEIDVALSPIASRVGINVFMNALNTFYYAHLMYDVFRGNADDLEREMGNLIRIHKENLELLISNNRQLRDIIEKEEEDSF